MFAGSKTKAKNVLAALTFITFGIGIQKTCPLVERKTAKH
jgi:hypothetical protein